MKALQRLVAAAALAFVVLLPALPAPTTAQEKGKGGGGAIFELYKDTAGEYRFRLKDGEGALLCSSGKGYKTKADCQKVIDAIKRDAAKAKVTEVK